MPLTLEQFGSQLERLLRAKPLGTSAELAEFIVAYWDGSQIKYAFLCEHGTGKIDEEFDLASYEWDEWEPELALWLAEPTFDTRPEIFDRVRQVT